MRALPDAERGRLLLWSVALCIGALLLAPLAARSSIGGIASERQAIDESPLRIASSRKSAVPMAVSLTRDPFKADDPGPRDSFGPAPARDPNTVVGSSVQAGTALDVPLPPNSGAMSDVPLATGTDGVLAVVTGAHPRALVIAGSRTRIVAVGDTLDGRRVRGITAAGVLLEDGSIRQLAEPPK